MNVKVFGLILSTLLLLTAPAKAVEYQGKNIDGLKLKGKAYYAQTGGVYDVTVLFKGTRATIFFVNGDQITIRLRQRVITDPNDIEGVGRLGQYDLGGSFSVGLIYGDNSTDNFGSSGLQPLQGFWRISLDLTGFSNPANKNNE